MKKLLVILVSLIGLNAIAQESPKCLNVMAVNGLNMRSQPDGHSRVVTKVPFGKQVEILERTDVELQLGWITENWYKVRFRGREGFIFGGYLSGLVAPIEMNVNSISEILPAYCSASMKQEGSAIHATERTRSGDTLRYCLLKFTNGTELELEELSDRSTAKMLCSAGVQEVYVLLEALLKATGNAHLLDELRFVKAKDGSLSRISTADGSVSIKALSEEITELKLTDYSTLGLSQD